jgi:transcription antitermination factor NusG
MLGSLKTHHAFRPGDEIVLSAGSYAGTTGVFLRLRPDAKWADVHEHSGANRSHPVELLAWHLFTIRASQN